MFFSDGGGGGGGDGGGPKHQDDFSFFFKFSLVLTFKINGSREAAKRNVFLHWYPLYYHLFPVINIET